MMSIFKQEKEDPMMSPLVVWITSGFPYSAGEQFIESEVHHWVDFPGRVVLLPENAKGVAARPVPPPLEVSTQLVDRWHRLNWQLLGAAQAFVSPLFHREFATLVRNRKVSRYRVKHAFLTVVRMKMEERVLRSISREHGRPIDVVYSYWMSVGAFAGCVGRRKGFVRKVVARAHRTDLYEDERPEFYTALVRQCAGDFSALFTISDDARVHAERYGFTPQQLRVSRLGVESRSLSSAGADDELRILSVSGMTPVKRVDLIAHSVAEVARRLPALHITWTHAGSGPEASKVSEVIVKEVAPLPNVTVELLGHVSNQVLMAWYAENPVDLLVNASSSEGVPVSVMEAMAHGVPSIGADVGAMREIIPPELLLPADFDVSQLADRIVDYAQKAKEVPFRISMADIQAQRYDSSINYDDFVAQIRTLAFSEQ